MIAQAENRTKCVSLSAVVACLLSDWYKKLREPSYRINVVGIHVYSAMELFFLTDP